MTSYAILAFIPSLGWQEMALILGIGLLLCGRRLPDVGRSIGRSVVEFKRGLSDASEDVAGVRRAVGELVPVNPSSRSKRCD